MTSLRKTQKKDALTFTVKAPISLFRFLFPQMLLEYIHKQFNIKRLRNMIVHAAL